MKTLLENPYALSIALLILIAVAFNVFVNPESKEIQTKAQTENNKNRGKKEEAFNQKLTRYVSAGVTKAPPHKGLALEEYLDSQTNSYVTLTQEQYEQFSSKTTDPDLLRYLKKRRTYTEFENYIQARGLSDEERLENGFYLIEKLGTDSAHEYLIASEIYSAKLSIIQLLPISQMEKSAMIEDIERSLKARAEIAANDVSDKVGARKSEYNSLEQNIISEIAALNDFPNGLTKQQYLEQQLLEARISVYGK